MNPSILVAILCHHDVPRLRRALDSILHPLGDPDFPRVKVLVLTHSKDPSWSGQAWEEVADKWSYPVKFEFVDRCSEAAAAPSGKQAILDFFVQHTDADYLVQLDGDDLLYPSWLPAIDDHLRRCHGPDAVAWYPADRLESDQPFDGFCWQVRPGNWGTVWESAKRWNDSTPLGPGRGGPWGTWPLGPPARVILWSRKAAAHVRFRGLDQGGPEDVWLLLDLLAAYLAGDLNVWTSMTSDIYLQDRGTPDSDQGTTDLREKQRQALRMAELAVDVVDPLRSSPGEFPVVWPTSGAGLISLEQKILSATKAVECIPSMDIQLDGHHHDDGAVYVPPEGPIGH